jgi:hypothetical protein
VKTIAKVQETKDYKKFRRHDMNRGMKPRPDLVRSMERDGWWIDSPMTVTKNGSGFIIKKGHNRFATAQKLGLPVRFIVVPEDNRLPHAYEHEKRWTTADVLNGYADAGFEEYIRLRNFMQHYHLPATISIGLMSGNINPDMDVFRSGLFKVTTMETADYVGSVLSFCQKYRKFSRQIHFARGLVKVMQVDGFDSTRFMQKFKTHHAIMDEKPTLNGFIEEIERVYNYRANPVVPLAVYAKQL